MFAGDVYISRRERLRDEVRSGLVLLLGNAQSPANFADNAYPFRQDSSFLYLVGLDLPDLAALIDIDEQSECVFGDDLTVDDVIWMGPQPSLEEKCRQVGISHSAPLDRLPTALAKARRQKRTIHFLPQYRAENVLRIQALLDMPAPAIGENVSEPLIRAVVAQRSVKSEEEIREIETAVDISYEMQTLAMKMSRPGIYERQVAAAMEGLVLSRGCRLAFPTIFSVHGETLHNPYHGNLLGQGDIAVNDSGAESACYYASDITRTIPVGGRFSQRQKEIYEIVLDAQEKAIAAIKPGVEFREIHRLACTVLAGGLKDLGLIKGDVEQAVESGAHTLFFQCGFGHMMGLDVHDMEALGEDFVGYDDRVGRNPEFGWKSLRLGRALEPGFVVTAEPGIYFIGALINRWKSENKCSDHINYDMVEKYRDFGGVRIEDDVLVTASGHRVLGRPIPKAIHEVEQMSSC
jgi:Xaa-Pro aminopeptidase